jgi:hypothetical protein
MPEIHAKFKCQGEKFGVKFTGRQRGISRDLKLYKFDGEKWHHLESESQKDSFIGFPGKVTEAMMKEWGKRKADWYVDGE